MACRPAPACKKALDETSSRFPDRNRASDGICASQQHSKQNPTSDHEPDEDGEATAYDLTHDPLRGVDCNAFVAMLVSRKDPRVKYIIWDRTIWRSYAKPGLPAWTPQKYTGSNPHTKHCHVSVLRERKRDTSPWWTAPKTEELTMDDEAKAAFAALSGRLDVIADVVGKTAGEIAVLRSAIKGVADDANGMSWLGERVAEIKADLDAVKEAHGITD